MSLGVGPAGGALSDPSALKGRLEAQQGRSTKSSFQNIVDQLRQDGETNNISKSFTGQTDSAEGDSRKEKLKNTAEEMEGLFLNMMMKQIRKTIPETSFSGEKSQGKKMFQAKLDRKYAEQMAENKSFGIAEAIYEQFTGEKMSDLKTSESSSDDSGLEMNQPDDGSELSMMDSTPRSAFAGL